jgi:hypothetical protein
MKQIFSKQSADRFIQGCDAFRGRIAPMDSRHPRGPGRTMPDQDVPCPHLRTSKGKTFATGSMAMSTAWDDEIERRIRVYEELEQNGGIAGRLGMVDYTALVAMVVVLAGGFWAWGGI